MMLCCLSFAVQSAVEFTCLVGVCTVHNIKNEL